MARFAFGLIALISGFLSGCVSAPPEETAVGEYLSARLAVRASDLDAAALAFSRADQNAAGIIEIKRSAFFYALAAGQIEAAARHAESLIGVEDREDGGFPEAVIAIKALKEKDYAKAQRLADKSGELGFPQPAATLMAVWAVAGMDGADAGAKRLNLATEAEYRGFFPLHEAILAENAGREADARTAYQLAVLAYSGSVEIAAYGAYLERIGAIEDARDYYDLLQNQGGFGRIVGEAGLRRLGKGGLRDSYTNVTPQRGTALGLYSLANAIMRNDFERREAAEAAGYRTGDADYNFALSLLQLAIYLYPEFDDANRVAGSVFNLYEDHNEAIKLLQRVSAASPFYEQAQIEIARAYAATEKTDIAIGLLKSLAKNSDASVSDARLSLAGLLAEKERHEEAVAALDPAIAAFGDAAPGAAWRYYLARGASYLELDAWALAEADLKKAVELGPNEAATLNYLGYSWAERGENLDEAFSLIERAIQLEPDSGAIIDSLGWAHFQLGNYDEAVGHLEQAASMEPADPTITDHLGDVYWRLNRRVEARYQWRRVLELEPSEDLAIQVDRKILIGLPEKAHDRRNGTGEN